MTNKEGPAHWGNEALGSWSWDVLESHLSMNLIKSASRVLLWFGLHMPTWVSALSFLGDD